VPLVGGLAENPGGAVLGVIGGWAEEEPSLLVSERVEGVFSAVLVLLGWCGGCAGVGKGAGKNGGGG
jgi:hypothetical protein